MYPIFYLAMFVLLILWKSDIESVSAEISFSNGWKEKLYQQDKE